MIRGFFRLIGLLLLVGGFLLAVYDGARSIADQTIRLTRLGEFWNDINQASQAAAQKTIEGILPWLWNTPIKFLLEQPTWAVLLPLGIFLMFVFRPRARLIGYGRD
jgi:hypothetical protein